MVGAHLARKVLMFSITRESNGPCDRVVTAFIPKGVPSR